MPHRVSARNQLAVAFGAGREGPLFCHPPPGPPALPHARQSRAVRVGAASATGAEPGRACHGPARLCELSVSAARAYAGMASRAGLRQLSLLRSSFGTALSQARYGASGLLGAPPARPRTLRSRGPDAALPCPFACASAGVPAGGGWQMPCERRRVTSPGDSAARTLLAPTRT